MAINLNFGCKKWLYMALLGREGREPGVVRIDYTACCYDFLEF